MPGPVVYVAVGICAVAAAIAFKQFIYDPHIHPQFREWREDMRERRRQRQRQRRMHTPVRARSASHDSDRAPLRSPSVHSQHSSVELDDLVAREVQAWRTTVLTEEGGAGLRRRTARSDGDNDDNHDVPQQPMQPAANVEANVLFSYPASPTLDPARSPSPATSSLTLGSASASNLTSSPLLSSRPPPPLHVPSDLHQPQAQPHTSAAHASYALGPAQAPLRSSTSTPDTDLLSASVLTSADGFFTPASAASTGSPPTVAAGTLSPRDAEMLLSPGSPAAIPPHFVNPLSPSEFTDALSPRSASGAMSPFSDLPSPRSDPLSLDFDVPHAEEEDERFTVLTGASTPLGSDDFDAFSDAGQSWTDGAR